MTIELTPYCAYLSIHFQWNLWFSAFFHIPYSFSFLGLPLAFFIGYSVFEYYRILFSIVCYIFHSFGIPIISLLVSYYLFQVLFPIFSSVWLQQLLSLCLYWTLSFYVIYLLPVFHYIFLSSSKCWGTQSANLRWGNVFVTFK